MESDELRQRLDLLERSEAAPYISYPPSPRWHSPVVGAWAAAMVGAFTWWRVNIALFLGTLAVLIAAELLFLWWTRRRNGALPMPGRGTPPPEIAAVWRAYFLALPVIALAIGLAWWLGGVPAGAAAAFVVVTGGMALYERRYDRAAAAVRSRLA